MIPQQTDRLAALLEEESDSSESEIEPMDEDEYATLRRRTATIADIYERELREERLHQAETEARIQHWSDQLDEDEEGCEMLGPVDEVEAYDRKNVKKRTNTFGSADQSRLPQWQDVMVKKRPIKVCNVHTGPEHEHSYNRDGIEVTEGEVELPMPDLNQTLADAIIGYDRILAKPELSAIHEMIAQTRAKQVKMLDRFKAGKRFQVNQSDSQTPQ
jgi:hypothetical protein